jgi:DNA-binding transcriptional LysR family regulator
MSRDLLVLRHGFVTDLPHRDLYRDEWLCIVSTGNPVAQGPLTVQHLERLPWVVSFHGPTASTPAARQIRCGCWASPRVQVVTENFRSLPYLVPGSDRIALMQRRLVDLLPLDAGVRAPCPCRSTPARSCRPCGGTRSSTTTTSTPTYGTPSRAPP